MGGEGIKHLKIQIKSEIYRYSMRGPDGVQGIQIEYERYMYSTRDTDRVQ